MVGRKPKLDPEKRRLVRAWYRIWVEVPTKREMCEYLGICETTLMTTARGQHKAERI